ncbi:MAG: LytTR family DNA-binding domain-containing protein [Lachnospiraceae bacterium]|nr:LytTR family DNA-binding domain-containing protein [Lachnospiraceae bacterium]
MKIAVCDDEIHFIDTVCSLVEKWAKERKIKLTIYRFMNGDDLIDAQKSECMDLIILDVIMPLLNGMDAARELRNTNQTVPIVFLTSSREFAVDSYEVKAFHYLLKPVNPAKLFLVLDDFLKTFKQPETFFTAKTADGFQRIDIADVDYLEAQNKQVLVHLSDDRTIVIRELFSKCVEFFSPENGFCCCHRSYIVNLSNVEQFSKTEVTTIHHAVIPISRNSYTTFKEIYFNYMFEMAETS